MLPFEPHDPVPLGVIVLLLELKIEVMPAPGAAVAVR
jgi:hypothetical protein